MAILTDYQKKIQAEATSGTAYSALSPEAQYYRQTGTFQTPTQTSTFLQPTQTSTYQAPTSTYQAPISTYQAPTQLFQPTTTQPTIDYSQFLKTKSATGYDIYQNGQYVDESAGLKLFSSGLNADFIKEGSVPTRSAEPTSQDFMSYYEGLSGKTAVDTAKGEYDAARTAADTAFSQGQNQIQGLIEGSQKLFNDLFNSPELTGAKDAQARAFSALQKLDAEEAQEVNALKEKVRSQGVVGWAARGQLGIIAEGFNAQKAGYLAQEAISANILDKGYAYATAAFNANIATLDAKIKLVQNVIDRAKTLSDDEKSEYSDILARAKELYTQKNTEKEDSIATYVELLKLGVKGITPGMSRDEMLRIAGPTVAQQALDKLAQEKRLKDAEIRNKEASTAGTLADNKLLSVSDAKALGVPYGTTVGQAKLLGKVPGGTTESKTDALSNLALVKDIIDLKPGSITGVGQNPLNFLGISNQEAINKFNQLKSSLSLENRQKLKGQGSVSDFEGKMLDRASSALGRNLPNDALTRELNRIKGVFTTAAGLEADVTVTSPSGEKINSTASRDEIDKLIAEGNDVDYR